MGLTESTPAEAPVDTTKPVVPAVATSPPQPLPPQLPKASITGSIFRIGNFEFAEKLEHKDIDVYQRGELDPSSEYLKLQFPDVISRLHRYNKSMFQDSGHAILIQGLYKSEPFTMTDSTGGKLTINGSKLLDSLAFFHELITIIQSTQPKPLSEEEKKKLSL